jgi:hypothetical protein
MFRGRPEGQGSNKTIEKNFHKLYDQFISIELGESGILFNSLQ